jgi:hypothetical protein
LFPEHTFREIIDLTQGDEPVIINEVIEVAPEVEQVFIPYTLDSPELYEDYSIIRNSCA